MIVDDVADELEEGEDDEEQGEGAEREEEVGGVGAHDVLVEQEREVGVEEASQLLDESWVGMVRVLVGRRDGVWRGGSGCVGGGDLCGGSAGGWAGSGAGEPGEGGADARGCDVGEHPAEGCGDGVEEVNQETGSGELLQEENAEGGEDEIGGPDTEGWGELTGLGEGDADVGEEIVGEDEEQREDNANALATAPGRETEWDADEHEDDACEGIGEAEIEFDAGCACVGGVEGGWGVSGGAGALQKFAERERVQGSV